MGNQMPSNPAPKPVSVQCPHCEKKLKIENPKLLGQKVKCPGCKASFVLPKPRPNPQPAKPDSEEEVELELVTDELPVGTSARWIPDSAEGDAATNPAPLPEQGFPHFGEPTASPAPAPVIQPAVTPSSGSALETYRSRRKKSRLPQVIAGICILVGVGVTAWLVKVSQSLPDPVPVADQSAKETSPEPMDANQPYSQAYLEGRPKAVDEFLPTSGEPVELLMMPRGVNVVIHLRPALLWSNELQYQELKASLTNDVTDWIAAQLKQMCRREPQEIEEACIGLILGASGTEPEVCVSVRLKEPAKMSDLIDEFDGEYYYEITDRPDLRLKVDDQYAYLIKDAQTFAICPQLYAAELEESQTQPFTLSVPLENLLRETDRDRLVTILGNVVDLKLHYEHLVPEPAHQSLKLVLDWIGEDVEAASWSIHPEPYLHSEIRLHPFSGVSPPKIQRRIDQQLEDLPELIWKNVCLKMTPREMRFRKFIGRFPAMLEAFQRSTVISTTQNYVSLTTVLPAKAAPNLALATLFTANEAARTDFTADVMIAANNNQSKLPETVVGRLQLPVDSEFNRTPLEQALQYLADEIQVNLYVDGDALKDAGYTKNMPQTFNLGTVPAIQSFAQIINSYQEPNKVMVMSIDEQTKTIHVLTEKFAKQKNMTIFQFPGQ